MRLFKHITIVVIATVIISAVAIALTAIAVPVQDSNSEVMAQETDRLFAEYEDKIASAKAGNYSDEDVEMLAKVMQLEAGSTWSDDTIMLIGEVVLNRVESTEFPNTIYEVLYQENPKQYATVWGDTWKSLEPDEKYIELAKRLLSGERPIDDKSIVFQALFPQGSSVAFMVHDDQLDNVTYFCRSNNPGLYD